MPGDSTEESISSVLANCQAICNSIEEKLDSMSASPPTENVRETEAIAKADTLIGAIAEDLGTALKLRIRLSHMDQHIANFITEAKSHL